MERVLFAFGIAVLSFLYGAATIQYEIFPYHLLREAKLGWEAWASVERQKLHFPNAFENFEPEAPGAPAATRLGEGAGEERILVTGGPYQLMERCPTWGCMAWIADRSGKVLHAWEVDLEALWSGITGFAGDVTKLSLYPVGMALGDDGSLVVSFQGRDTYPYQVGIAKVDRGGRILWKRFDNSHHWITMDGKGRVYTPYAYYRKDVKEVAGTRVSLPCEAGEAYMDGVRVLSPDGQALREITLMDKFVAAGYRGLFYGLRDGCNPTHLNSVELASAEVARRVPRAAEGDLLVSLREASAVALLDGASGAVKYVVSQHTAAQHSPRFLPDGTVLVFDNFGGDSELGGSRVVRVDLVRGTSETVFPREAHERLVPFFSATAGHIDVSEDGRRALVATTHQGRIIEIDVASGRPLWVYENTHDIARFLEANDLRTDQTRARFATYGAYYVGHPSFLKEDS
jgi:hypothetical protein